MDDDKLLCTIDSSECSIMITLNQTTAFDNVDQHVRCIEHMYGISRAVLFWLTLYAGQLQSEVISGCGSRDLLIGFPCLTLPNVIAYQRTCTQLIYNSVYPKAP